MNVSDHDPFLVVFKRRQAELIQEAALDRLVKEAYPAGGPGFRGSSRILARIGKELAGLGLYLEARYGAQRQH